MHWPDQPNIPVPLHDDVRMPWRGPMRSTHRNGVFNEHNWPLPANRNCAYGSLPHHKDPMAGEYDNRVAAFIKCHYFKSIVFTRTESTVGNKPNE